MTSPLPDPHPRDGDALDYVIGTLDAAERARFARDMAQDRGLAAAVRDWQERLAPLSEAVPAVEPDPGLWDRVLARLDASAPPAVSLAEVAALRRSGLFWRRAAAATTALAAVLALAVGLRSLAPAPSAPTLVAVVNRDGALPALLVRVDPAAGTVQVRSLAAEEPAGRSLELWSVAAGASPRSLGLVGGSGVTRIALPADLGRPAPGTTLAVSVEPPGGSSTGLPTGPVVYSGRLLAEE